MRKIRTGILGLGRLGYMHAKSMVLAIPETALIAACSLNPEELQKSVFPRKRISKNVTNIN